MMNPRTRKLHDLGQRIWLDQITRELLTTGTLARYIAELSVTGLTSNPTIFEKAIKGAGGSAYDSAIAALAGAKNTTEDVFFALALQDLTAAADLFKPLFVASEGRDGWVSLEVPPPLAHLSAGTTFAAVALHARAARANLFMKIPGTLEGLQAIEDTIFAGVPVNVTLLFSAAHCDSAANAYLRALERRQAAGLPLNVASVASLFVSRWDAAAKPHLPAPLQGKLGIAVATEALRAHTERLRSPRWQALARDGARPQRLLWASTGSKDPAAPDTFYVDALVADNTINTMPEPTLLAFADHGEPGPLMPTNGGDASAVLQAIREAGVDLAALANQLQTDGLTSFAASWSALLAAIEAKRA